MLYQDLPSIAVPILLVCSGGLRSPRTSDRYHNLSAHGAARRAQPFALYAVGIETSNAYTDARRNLRNSPLLKSSWDN